WTYMIPALVFPVLVAAALLGRLSAFLPLTLGAGLMQLLFVSFNLARSLPLTGVALYNSIFVIVGILAALFVCYTSLRSSPAGTTSSTVPRARPVRRSSPAGKTGALTAAPEQ